MLHIPCAVILCRPEESRNVGSCCRAMLNMGLDDLRIVGRREDLDETQVRILAVHAGRVWETARFFEPTAAGLREAIADCTLAAGTTRRLGQKRKSWGMTPAQFSALAKGHGKGIVGVVFGNERTGLTDEELDCCSLAVNIPTGKEFPSLNLSHAVQLMAYELFKAFDERKRGYEPVSLERLEKLAESLSEDIARVGLYKRTGAGENERFLREILSRAALSEGEAARLERLFHRIAHVKTGSPRDK